MIIDNVPMRPTPSNLTINPDLPVYVSQSTVGRYLGVGRAAVANWLVRHPDSIPPPAAWVQDRQRLIPLWTDDQLAAWRRWFLQLAGDEL